MEVDPRDAVDRGLVAGSFALDVSDRWGDTEAVADHRGRRVPRRDRQRQVVIDGYRRQARDISADAESRVAVLRGARPRADLVDCSLLVADGATKGHKWTYRNLDIALSLPRSRRRTASRCSVQSGLTLKKDPLLVAHPGETGLEAIKRAAGSAGVLVVSDGAGGIVITRAGTARAAPLVEKREHQGGEDHFDHDRPIPHVPDLVAATGHRRGIRRVAARPGHGHGRRRARTNRVLLIRPDKGYNAAAAQSGERTGRLASAPRARRPPASPYRAGAAERQALAGQHDHVGAGAQRSLGIDGDMLISQVEFTIGDGGASRSSPRASGRVHAGAAERGGGQRRVGAWKELAHGAKPEPVR
jgi:hypothetical protein